MYIIYYSIVDTYIIYTYIPILHRRHCRRFANDSTLSRFLPPPTTIPFRRSAHKPSLTIHVSRHTTVIPHPSATAPPVILSLYIITYTTPPSVPGRARRS